MAKVCIYIYILGNIHYVPNYYANHVFPRYFEKYFSKTNKPFTAIAFYYDLPLVLIWTNLCKKKKVPKCFICFAKIFFRNILKNVICIIIWIIILARAQHLVLFLLAVMYLPNYKYIICKTKVVLLMLKFIIGVSVCIYLPTTNRLSFKITYGSQ